MDFNRAKLNIQLLKEFFILDAILLTLTKFFFKQIGCTIKYKVFQIVK